MADWRLMRAGEFFIACRMERGLFQRQIARNSDLVR